MRTRLTRTASLKTRTPRRGQVFKTLATVCLNYGPAQLLQELAPALSLILAPVEEKQSLDMAPLKFKLDPP